MREANKNKGEKSREPRVLGVHANMRLDRRGFPGTPRTFSPSPPLPQETEQENSPTCELDPMELAHVPSFSAVIYMTTSVSARPWPAGLTSETMIDPPLMAYVTRSGKWAAEKQGRGAEVRRDERKRKHNTSSCVCVCICAAYSRLSPSSVAVPHDPPGPSELLYSRQYCTSSTITNEEQVQGR